MMKSIDFGLVFSTVEVIGPGTSGYMDFQGGRVGPHVGCADVVGIQKEKSLFVISKVLPNGNVKKTDILKNPFSRSSNRHVDEYRRVSAFQRLAGLSF